MRILLMSAVSLKQEYKLPSGVIARTRKPLNKDRRALLDSESANLRVMVELLLAECLVELEWPVDHEDKPEGELKTFSDLDKDKWSRLDELDMSDVLSLTEAFGENNWPDQKLIKSVVEANKLKKA